jgi:hypothetical protein
MLVQINGHVVQIGPEGQQTLSAEDITNLKTAAAAGDEVGAAVTDEDGRIAAGGRWLGGLAGLALALGSALTRIAS